MMILFCCPPAKAGGKSNPAFKNAGNSMNWIGL